LGACFEDPVSAFSKTCTALVRKGGRHRSPNMGPLARDNLWMMKIDGRGFRNHSEVSPLRFPRRGRGPLPLKNLGIFVEIMGIRQVFNQNVDVIAYESLQRSAVRP